jgi:hypothetical protein
MAFIVTYNVIEALFVFVELRVRGLILSLVVLPNVKEGVVHSK